MKLIFFGLTIISLILILGAGADVDAVIDGTFESDITKLPLEISKLPNTVIAVAVEPLTSIGHKLTENISSITKQVAELVKNVLKDVMDTTNQFKEEISKQTRSLRNKFNEAVDTIKSPKATECFHQYLPVIQELSANSTSSLKLCYQNVISLTKMRIKADIVEDFEDFTQFINLSISSLIKCKNFPGLLSTLKCFYLETTIVRNKLEEIIYPFSNMYDKVTLIFLDDLIEFEGCGGTATKSMLSTSSKIESDFAKCLV